MQPTKAETVELRFEGDMLLLAFVPQDSTVSEIAQAFRQDAIRSLLTRLLVTAESLEDAAGSVTT